MGHTRRERDNAGRGMVAEQTATCQCQRRPNHARSPSLHWAGWREDEGLSASRAQTAVPEAKSLRVEENPSLERWLQAAKAPAGWRHARVRAAVLAACRPNGHAGLGLVQVSAVEHATVLTGPDSHGRSLVRWRSGSPWQ